MIITGICLSLDDVQSKSMSSEQEKNGSQWTGAGIGIGLALGAAIGLAMDSLAIGVAFGLVFGIGTETLWPRIRE